MKFCFDGEPGELCDLLNILASPGSPDDDRVVFTIGLPVEQTGPAGAVPPGAVAAPGRRRAADMAFTMTDSQQVPVSAKFEDKRGNPVALSAVPEWLTDNPNVLTLEPADGGMSCVVKAAGPLGTATVTVNATGPGGDIAGRLAVEVVSGAATQIELTPGTPAEQA